MNKPTLEEVFKTGGVPTYTLVEPSEYPKLLVALRTPGRGVVIEGPSGIGKTTAVATALKHLQMETRAAKLSARKKEDVEYIVNLPSLGEVGTVIVDDFHKLSDDARASLADYLKILADEELPRVKLVIVGINNAGEHLINLAHDLVNRIDIIRFESNPDEKVEQLIKKGEMALNVSINVIDEVIRASQGSFYLAQMLCREICTKAGILDRSPIQKTTTVSFEAIRADVWLRLKLVFNARCERFCRGTRIKPAGRAPYLHLLYWLAQSDEWSLSLRHAIRNNPNLRGSVGQIVDKGYVRSVIDEDPDLQMVLHYDANSQQLIVEDPQFLFFLRNIRWRYFAHEVGFLSVDFPFAYDFALSFAGQDRYIAEALARALEDHDIEVFYDRNEQHRILASDVEEYLRPIYHAEARFVIVLLSEHYPTRIWTKIESDSFKNRFSEGAIIPVWFSNAPPIIFDESRRIGGIEIDQSEPIASQIGDITNILVKKLAETRVAESVI